MQNEFLETDCQIDLFNEIYKSYEDKESVFDDIRQDDLIFSFFPCTRFEEQAQMHFRGIAFQMKKWTDEEKLENDLILHRELSELYELVTKLAIICIRRKIPLIIENPYSATHYLTKYWAIPYSILDKDRTVRGDYYKKPTQYWFINCKPQQNMILEAYTMQEKKTIEYTHSKTERSLISSEYANRFIREFIL